MGFDYEIHYRSGKENLAADALSRLSSSDILYLAISIVATDMADQIKSSYHLDYNLVEIVEELQDTPVFIGYSLKDGLLRKKIEL